MKILVITGGGVFGYIPATLLTNSHLNQHGYEIADVFGGTSVGGILTMMLNYGYKPTELKDIFSKMCLKAFSNSFWDSLKIFGPRYTGINLEKGLYEIFGEDTFGSLKKPIFISSVDFKHNIPKIMDNITEDEDNHWKLWEISRITSAAPTYFPPYKNYIDGGLIANNPVIITTCGIKDKMGIPFNEMDVFVIGTGSLKDPNRNMNSVKSWSSVQWLMPLLDYLTNANEMCADFEAKQIGFKSYTYFNPVILDGWDMDRTDILNDLDKLINPYQIEFNKLFRRFLIK